MRAFILRFSELLFANIILSAAATALFDSGFFMLTVQGCTRILAFAAILFIVFNISRLRHCFFEMRSRALFYTVNFAAYAAFIAVNLISQSILGKELYTWLFALTKLWSIMCEYSISNFASAVIFHTVMLIVTALSPLGMSWVFEIEDEEEEPPVELLPEQSEISDHQ